MSEFKRWQQDIEIYEIYENIRQPFQDNRNSKYFLLLLKKPTIYFIKQEKFQMRPNSDRVSRDTEYTIKNVAAKMEYGIGFVVGYSENCYKYNIHISTHDVCWERKQLHQTQLGPSTGQDGRIS